MVSGCASISWPFIWGRGNGNFIILLFSTNPNHAKVWLPCGSDAALGCEHRGLFGVPFDRGQ
jgi:hypothetical protein